MYSKGNNIGFVVSPSELQNTENFTVSIESVANAAGNTNALTLKPEDFITNLNPTTKELTLSEKGLNKVNTIKTLEDATAYKYDVTFKFTTTSDAVANKTVFYTSTVSLIKLVTVTEDMFKKMIRATPKLTITNRKAFDGYESSFEIDFKLAADLTSLKGITHISSMPSHGGMTRPTKMSATYSTTASGLIPLQFGTPETRKFISSNYCKTNKLILDNKSREYYSFELNYVFIFKKEDYYILDDSISFITNEGIIIRVLFSYDGEWVED